MMKAFKKWWNRTDNYFNSPIKGLNMQEGWRAALEEILKQVAILNNENNEDNNDGFKFRVIID